MDFDLDTLKNQAIEAAISGNWPKAIELNKKIIAAAPDNLNSYLRLGFAQLQLGQLSHAKKAYLKALKIQPGHQIALNNLEKIRILQNKGEKGLDKEKNQLWLDPNLFLNIPGKTKVVSLINLGQISILAKLKIGQKLCLKIKKRKVEVRTESDEYIGVLPDDISKRLIIFLKAKSQYISFIKEVTKRNVDVFIKEKKRGKKVRHYSSFPKNLQEDIKTITANEESVIPELEEAEIDKDESPFDLEKLADEVEEKEYYPEAPLDEEKDDFEE